MTTIDKRELSIPLAIVIAGAMIAGAVYIGGSRGPVVAGPKGNAQAQEPSGEVQPVASNDHVLGDAGAEVTVIEYSDFECPFCKTFHSTMHQILAAYPGKVNWVYRHFPIVSLHSKAPKEAEASECAYEQGGNKAFWDFADQIFAITGSNDKLDHAQLPIIAGQLGLNVTQFNTCLSSGKYTEQIEADVAEAVAAGAQGTPYSVIITKDGKEIVINGAEPFASVKAKIDSALK